MSAQLTQAAGGEVEEQTKKQGGPADVSTVLNSVVAAYASDFVGREKEIRMIVLSLISKEHIYMISPPGTGKTMLRAVAESFGMKFFYYLMNYDTKLEDIVAVPKVKKVRRGDEELLDLDYELRDPGLATAEAVFLDEMFKANTTVLNALLGIINERVLTIGNREIKVPLWTLVGASNEVPTDASAQAFLDRFLFRDFISYLPKDLWYDYLLKYWAMHQPSYKRVKVVVPKDVLAKAYDMLWTVDIYGVIDDYLKVLDRLKEKGIEISDRRKGRTLKAIAASAVLGGRDYADITDLEVLLYTIPKDSSEAEAVAKVVDDVLGGHLKLKEELDNIAAQIRGYMERLRTMDYSGFEKLFNDVSTMESRLIQISVPSLSRYVEKVRKRLEELKNAAIDVLADKLIKEVVESAGNT